MLVGKVIEDGIPQHCKCSGAGTTYDNMNILINEVLLALAASGAGVLQLSEAQLIDIAEGAGNYGNALGSFFSSNFDTTDVSKPHAYLVWMLYDNSMNLLPQGSGAKRVTDPNELKQLLGDDIPVVEDGYLHAYVSNGSAKGVSFDNFLLTYLRGNTRQINHYYPYGLSIDGLDHSDEYLNKYTTKELQTGEFVQYVTSGLEMFDFGSRFYDPQLGRWSTPDPAEQFANPYLAMGNNPVNGIDPNGEFFIGTAITGFIESAKATLQTVWGFGEMVFSDHTWKEFNAEYRSNMRNLDPTSSGTKFNNAIKIDVGQFKTDPTRDPASRAWQIVSRFNYEFFPNLIGNGYSHVRNLTGDVEVSYYRNATIVNKTDPNKNRSGTTIGSYINSVNMKSDPYKDKLFRHEYGHVIQSAQFGFLYPPLIMLPSGLGAYLDDQGYNHNHDTDEWNEINANIKANRYFKKRHPDVLDPKKDGIPWDHSYNSTTYNPSPFWYFFPPPIWYWF